MSLPYDAEVEWIYSDSTNNFIPTQIQISAGCEIGGRVLLRKIGVTFSAFAFGGYWQSGRNGSFQFGYETSGNEAFVKAYADSTTTLKKIILGTEQEYLVDVAMSVRNGFVVNGDKVSDVSSLMATGSVSLGLFGRGNTSGGMQTVSVNIGLARAYVTDSNGSYICDLIPVRVGKVGYMYDKVSGQLFGNAGTGAFVLGPDVKVVAVEPKAFFLGAKTEVNKVFTARDYVQDGLIFHWDAIENTGYGTHEDNPTHWVDLAGSGLDIPLTGRSDEWSFAGGEFESHKENAILYKSHPQTTVLDGTVSTTVEWVARVTKGADTSSMRWVLSLNSGGAGSRNQAVCGYSNWVSASDVYHNRVGIASSFADNRLLWTQLGDNFNNESRFHYSVTIELLEDNTTCKVSQYLNGSLVTQGNVENVSIITLNDWYLSLGDRDGHARASVIRYYTRALSAAEIAHNYEVDIARFLFVHRYATDGLIAMWDGQWNVGKGRHDSNSKVWVDCIGGLVATLNAGPNFTKEQIFDANSVVLDNTFSFRFEPNATITQILDSDFTIEVLQLCGQPEFVDSIPFIGFGAYGNSFMQTAGQQNSSKCRMGVNSEVQAGAPAEYRGKPICTAYTMNRETGETASYYNGINFYKGTRTTQSAPATEGHLFGTDDVFFGGSGKYWTPNPPADGHAYCVRVYNRALSEQEIVANYAEDVRRFGL